MSSDATTKTPPEPRDVLISRYVRYFRSAGNAGVSPKGRYQCLELAVECWNAMTPDERKIATAKLAEPAAPDQTLRSQIRDRERMD